METSMTIPVIARDPLTVDDPEYREMMKYESGTAEQEAAAIPGKHQEPWLNVLDTCEPASQHAIDLAFSHPEIRPLIRGRAIDLGAGTCWTTAKLSKLEQIEGVVAMDLSERFLQQVGSRIIRHFGGDCGKISFAVGSFNRLPFPAGSFDCAFLLAAIHHSLSPVKTLLEVRRALRADGALIVVEAPYPVMKIRRGRKQAIALSRSSGATEMCYTKGELDYMIRHAGFDEVSYYPDDFLTRGALRRTFRRGLRILGVEDFVKPPNYIIVARSRPGNAPT
jgi:SAM-dependent methyltransferase